MRCGLGSICPSLAEFNRLGFLVTRDRCNDVEPGRSAANSEAGQAEIVKTIGQLVEGLPASGRNHHAFARRNQCRHGVQNRLGVATARQRLDGKAFAVHRPGDNSLLGRVCVGNCFDLLHINQWQTGKGSFIRERGEHRSAFALHVSHQFNRCGGEVCNH